MGLPPTTCGKGAYNLAVPASERTRGSAAAKRKPWDCQRLASLDVDFDARRTLVASRVLHREGSVKAVNSVENPPDSASIDKTPRTDYNGWRCASV